SDDLVGQVRLTAKMPEYLACGRFIVATAVGGAQQFAKDCGVLLESRGVTDPEYVGKIASVIEDLLQHPSRLRAGCAGVEIARRYFQYDVLRAQLRRTIELAFESRRRVRVERQPI